MVIILEDILLRKLKTDRDSESVDSQEEIEMGEYEIYVTCEQLKDETGLALTDTEAQESLVRQNVLKSSNGNYCHCPEGK